MRSICVPGAFIRRSMSSLNRKEPGVYRTAFSLRAKTLYGEMEFVGKMAEEILFTSKLEDEKRLYEIVAQLKSRRRCI